VTTIAADPKHLGAKIGVTAVPYTWRSAKTHHPHVHMIVTDGGIFPDSRMKLCADICDWGGTLGPLL